MIKLKSFINNKVTAIKNKKRNRKPFCLWLSIKLKNLSFKLYSKSIYYDLKNDIVRSEINNETFGVKVHNYRYQRGRGKSYNVTKLALEYDIPIVCINRHKMDTYRDLSRNFTSNPQELKFININNPNFYRGARGKTVFVELDNYMDETKCYNEALQYLTETYNNVIVIEG